jgi:hypothetical protein
VRLGGSASGAAFLGRRPELGARRGRAAGCRPAAAQGRCPALPCRRRLRAGAPAHLQHGKVLAVGAEGHAARRVLGPAQLPAGAVRQRPDRHADLEVRDDQDGLAVAAPQRVLDARRAVVDLAAPVRVVHGPHLHDAPVLEHAQHVGRGAGPVERVDLVQARVELHHAQGFHLPDDQAVLHRRGHVLAVGREGGRHAADAQGLAKVHGGGLGRGALGTMRERPMD